MDMIEMLHGPQVLYCGPAPSSPDQYLKRFLLNMGYSASNFAPNRRDSRVAASAAGPRSLADLSPVSQILQNRYCHSATRGELVPGDVEKILKKRRSSDEDIEYTGEASSNKSDLETPKKAAEDTTSDSDEINEANAVRRWETEGHVGPVQLLRSLRNALQLETLEMTFDHLRLHRMCWDLLRNLKHDLNEDFKRVFGSGYLEKENQLPFLIGYIFMTATATKSLQSQAKLLPVRLPREFIVTNQYMVRAATAIKTMGDSGAGGLVLQILNKFDDIEIEIQSDDDEQGVSLT